MSKTLLFSDAQPLPYAYRWLVEQEMTKFGFTWRFIEDQSISDGLREEFLKEVAAPNTTLVKDFQPFASGGSGNGDDAVAGFVIHDGQLTKQVVQVHLTWCGKPETPNWPGMTLYDDVWAWLAECVVEDMRFFAEIAEGTAPGAKAPI